MSNVMEEESVVAVTCVPALPAVSLKSIVKATAPSVSPDASVNAAVQSVPVPVWMGVLVLVVVPSPSWPL